jgi:NAD(P)H-hydrate repair Nnr-like enzyme with NAD(P)H-hydrate dehydratase domain
MIWFLSNAEEREHNIEALKYIGNRAVITPNVVEFARLVKEIMPDIQEQEIESMREREIKYFDSHIG